MSVVRAVECPRCGAKSDHLDGGAYLCCAHCGALVGLREGMLFGEERAAMIRDAIRQQVRPTDAEARSTELSMRMAEAQKDGDRRTWRAAMREYLLLLPVTKPAMLPPEVRTEAQLAAHVDRSVAAAELSSFDPDIQAAMSGMDASALYSGGDPVEGARAYLAGATAYFEAIRHHPDYPEDYAQRMDVGGMAKDNLRAMLAGLASMLGPAAVKRIYVEVLGAKELAGAESACLHCGAPIARDAARCAYCLTELSHEASDAWLSSMVTSFEAVKASVRDPAQLATVALSMPLSGAHFGGEVPPAADVRRFLEAAVPYLSRRVLLTAIAQLAPAYPGGPLDELAASLRERWEPTPEPARAVPEMPSYESVEIAGRESAWVRQQLALWPHARPDDEESRAFTVVSMALAPFSMGSVVSAEEMVAFVRAAEPELPRAALAAALDQLGMAYAAQPDLLAPLRLMRALALGDR